MIGVMLRRIIAAAVLALAPASFGGCSLTHHDATTPQQQFMTALQHGNGAAMNQIWLNMSAEDRANFSHSQGFKPVTSPDEIKSKLQEAIAAKNQGGDADAPSFAAADGSEQQTEIPTVNTGGGGIDSLPGLAASSAPAQ